MDDRFAPLIDPIVQYTLGLQRSLNAGDDPSLGDVRRDLIDLFEDSSRKAAGSRELAADYAEAMPALVYWVDEVLINSRWSQADGWREQILEWHFYRERLGGEKFFRMAEGAERRAGTDPLEVYFVCVALGFHGQYAMDHPELQRWASRVFSRIASTGGPPEKFLPDETDEADYGPLGPLPGRGLLLTLSVLTSITAIAALVAFLLASEFAT